MNELLLKVIEEEEWKPLRFTVYNQLEEKEFYQKNLERLGYESGYDDLEGKTLEVDNLVAKTFKTYIEKKLQDDVVIAVCVIENRNYFTVVKPKGVDMLSKLKLN